MRGRGVEVEVVLLDVLTVIALIAGQTRIDALSGWDPSVPERQRKADLLVAVADARQAILIPAVRARASMIVREILPSIAVRAVVLTHRAPGALAEVGTPAFPVLLAALAFAQSDLFFCHAPCPSVRVVCLLRSYVADFQRATTVKSQHVPVRRLCLFNR